MAGPKEYQVSTLGTDVRKADTKALITNATESFPEDIFEGQYWTGANTGTPAGVNVAIVEPTYKPATLVALANQNNALLQCVEAMEVNIDGTGHSIELVDEEGKDDEAEKEMLEDFFREPYPGKTMIEIRRAIRRDLEFTGNGYMEVIRSADDQIIMLNNLSASEIRLVRLDDPITVPREMVRSGKPLQVRVRVRERRFVQNVNGKRIYFKEYGALRDIDRDTGVWAKEGTRLPIEKRGSEILHFTGNMEARTPYGSPRWINQLPSVLGSRKAEEYNLDFFDGGGVPPIMILIEGGALPDNMRDTLNNHLSARANRHRAVVVEAVSTSGSLETTGTVRMKVERFGDRTNDAMFQKYDESTGEHVRIAFRLPPLFIGKAADYSYASAYASYMVAEAQVFLPEREEFDAKLNNTVVKGLGAEKYKFHSLPLTLVDAATQLQAIELVASNKFVGGEDIVKKLNDVTGLELSYEEPEEPDPPVAPVIDPNNPDAQDQATGAGNLPPGQNPPPTVNRTAPGANPQPPGAKGAGNVGTAQNAPAPTKKAEVSSDLIALASDWAAILGLEGDDAQRLYSETDKRRIYKEVTEMEDPEELRLFNQLLAAQSITASGVDVVGLGELAGCACGLHAE